MELISTRNTNERLEALDAALRGIAPDGGLYVPVSFPKIGEIGRLSGLSYPTLAAHVLGLYFENVDAMGALTEAAYESFDDEHVAPVRRIAEGEYVMELWHGPTLAFKDMALSVLPRLMTAAMKEAADKDVLILVATSGDTGKAALEGFCGVPGTRIVVFYPDEGVSDMQRLQMVTQEGANTQVVAVRGNFDDAQNGVKAIFGDAAFANIISQKGYTLSSANSINFGRLAPQIAYYIWAYADLLRRGEIFEGEAINFVVPTGNFGNILAAYYAKQMGLPIGKLICASNKNNVLTDFFNKGEYTLKRDFYKTMSPSMDILISSNLERLLFELVGRDAGAVGGMMQRLKDEGAYAIDGAAKDVLSADFYADWCSEEETMMCIKDTFDKHGYLLDTHTAVAAGVYEKYKRMGDKAKTVIVSTASPYKFPQDVLRSLGENTDGMSAFDMAKRLYAITGMPVPQQIKALEMMPVRHSKVIGKDDMRNAVLDAL